MAENAIIEKIRGILGSHVEGQLEAPPAARKMPRSWLPLHDKRQVLYRDEINRAWSNAVT